MENSQQRINRQFYRDLSCLFTPTSIRRLVSEGFGSQEKSLLAESGLLDLIGQDASLAQMYNFLYEELLINYRCEYVYKNIIATQLLVHLHDVDTSALLLEHRINHTIADVVILNGTSTVYEIKTQLDSFSRLEEQILSYLKTFEYAYIVTHPAMVDKLWAIIENYHSIGIISLSDYGELNVVQKASSNLHTIQPSFIFDSLRRTEYEWIVEQHFGFIPDVPNTEIFDACKPLYCSLDASAAHSSMVRVLKNRVDMQRISNLLGEIPHSLYALWLTGKLKTAQIQKLPEVLQLTISEILTL